MINIIKIIFLLFSNCFYSQIVCECDTIQNFIIKNHSKQIDKLVIRNCDSLNFDISNMKINELSITGQFEIISPTFIFPKSLKELSISSPLVEYPQSLEDIKNLHTLLLDNCKLKKINPIKLKSLTNLKKLCFGSFLNSGSNNIFDTINDDFFNNSAEYINLSNCQVKYIKLKKTNNRCKKLDLDKNSINCFIGVDKFNKLEYLSLDDNKLKKLPFVDLKYCRTVKHLSLNSNDFDSFPTRLIYFSNLRYLNLGSNNIDKIPNSILKFKKLYSLSLAYCQLKEIQDVLVNSRIIDLDIRENPIKSFGHKFIKSKMSKFIIIEASRENKDLDSLITIHKFKPYNVVDWNVVDDNFKINEKIISFFFSKNILCGAKSFNPPH